MQSVSSLDWISFTQPNSWAGNPVNVLGYARFRSAVLLEMHVERETNVWVYYGREYEFDVYFDTPSRVRFHAAQNTVIFQYVPADTSLVQVGEPDFVNIDSMPETSGHMQQVMAALRAQELRHRQDLAAAYIAIGQSAVPEPVMPSPTADGDTDV